MSEAVSFDKKDFQKGLGAYLLFKNDTAKPTGDLLKWVNYQNSCRKKSRDGKHTKLTADRIEMLDQVQFPWKLSHDERWNQRFRQLSVFKEQHGHCKVPQGQGFGDWVHNQRKARNQHLQGKKMASALNESKSLIRLDLNGTAMIGMQCFTSWVHSGKKRVVVLFLAGMATWVDGFHINVSATGIVLTEERVPSQTMKLDS